MYITFNTYGANNNFQPLLILIIVLVSVRFKLKYITLIIVACKKKEWFYMFNSIFRSTLTFFIIFNKKIIQF